MKRLFNFLRGVVTLTAAGPFPERLLNLCAQGGIAFWAVEWLDERTVRLTIRRMKLKRLRELAERVGCEVAEEKRGGLPDFLARFRSRYAFLAGLALALCAVALLSRFVLVIDVTGNEKVSTAAILTQLRQLGVRPGVYGPSIDRQHVAQQALLELDGLSWMGINLHGTRLEVIVREVVPAPERVEERICHDIVAEADGIITHVEAELGDAKVKEGDTVLAGEVLISGTVTMEPPKYSDLPNRYYQTHARGRVWARTWRTLTAAIPVEAVQKVYTGEDSSTWSLTLMGRRMTLWRGNVEGAAEGESRVWQAVLPGDVVFPVSLKREISRGYREEVVPVNLDAAQSLLEERLSGQLKELAGKDGEVLDTSFTGRVEDGLLKVTLHAECREEIGREVPGAPLPESAMPEETG